MIVAHDPGLRSLAVDLAGSGDPELLQALATKFPTTGLAVIDFDAQAWSKVRRGAGRLRDLHDAQAPALTSSLTGAGPLP